MRTFDAPRARFKEVTLGMLAHKSGPNILLGLLIGATIETFAPFTWGVPALAALAWAVAVVIYSATDELAEAIEAEKNRKLVPLDDDERPRGVE